MQKLLLIDGNAILHRAYHAYPPVLTNSKGMVVNAVYGFFSMFLVMIADQRPDYVAVCFDRPGPTFRQSMFAGYHAHRPKLSDDFVPQIVLVHELLEKMKVGVFELDGFEADDLIGTIAVKAVESIGVEVVILTGDRDMLQLVNARVKVLMPLIGITKTLLFDNSRVEEKYGVRPDQFVDYKALIGDASDGYPGVTGVGPKTASGLLQKYGTFENLYEHVGELPEKVGLKLATDAEQAALAIKLAAIITDSPIQFDIAKCQCADFDLKALKKGFEEQGFKSLIGRLDSLYGAEVVEVEKKEKVMKKKEKKKSEGQLELL